MLDYPGAIRRVVAQVKTTTSKKFLEQYDALLEHGLAEQADIRWFDVVLTSTQAFVFEKIFVSSVPLGIEATGTVRRGRDRTRAKTAKGSSRFRRRVQADDSREGRRRDGLA